MKRTVLGQDILYWRSTVGARGHFPITNRKTLGKGRYWERKLFSKAYLSWPTARKTDIPVQRSFCHCFWGFGRPAISVPRAVGRPCGQSTEMTPEIMNLVAFYPSSKPPAVPPLNRVTLCHLSFSCTNKKWTSWHGPTLKVQSKPCLPFKAFVSN